MKTGDKYVIEIEDVFDSEVGKLYRVKGLEHALFQEKDFEKLEEITDLSKSDIFEEGRMTGWRHAVGYMSSILEEMGKDVEDEIEIEIRLNNDLMKSLFGDDDE